MVHLTSSLNAMLRLVRVCQVLLKDEKLRGSASDAEKLKAPF